MSKPRLQTLKLRVQSAPGRVAVMQPGSWRNDKQSSTQRGYGYKWQQARAGYLAKHPFCVFCLRDAGILTTVFHEVILECSAKQVPVPYASIVDHIDPHRGDMVRFWDKSRWQSLCAHHHSADKQRIEAAEHGAP